MSRLAPVFLALVLGVSASWGDEPKAKPAPAFEDYFRAEVARIEAAPLAGIDSAERWKTDRPMLRRQLAEMLGLWPLPEKTDLKTTVTGTVERPEFLVEKLHYQSLPGLYVTANLYRPRDGEGRRPAVLYVCGHGKVEKDGVIFGNKTHYQHHAEWYAANGYVCLVLDTLQLGEVPGLHHGTNREKMWWWFGRGYTPAGVEAWNGIRALDLLCARSDVDPARIGLTGRSGGGAYSWFVAALDERVAAVAPVAGITDLRNHVVDGVVQGHCDCMYFVNTYRWDYDVLAALVAPRPLLVENTDTDPIFPEDGVRRIYGALDRVYGWHGASERLGLVMGKGGHADTEELRHPSFAFMERWLKGETNARITEPDRRLTPAELKVLPPKEIPSDTRNATIQEEFVRPADEPPVPRTREEWNRRKAQWMEQLRTLVFAGWPRSGEEVALGMKTVQDETRDGVRLQGVRFMSQVGIPASIWWLSDANAPVRSVTLHVLDDTTYRESFEPLMRGDGSGSGPDWQALEASDLRKSLRSGASVMLFAPRGVMGPGGEPMIPAAQDTHVRRRFYLLGQTLDGMRVYDVLRALKVARETVGKSDVPIEVRGKGPSAPLALWAAIFDPNVAGVVLEACPATFRQGPAFLNAERVLGMPQAAALMESRPIRWIDEPKGLTEWSRQLAKTLGGSR